LAAVLPDNQLASVERSQAVWGKKEKALRETGAAGILFTYKSAYVIAAL